MRSYVVRVVLIAVLLAVTAPTVTAGRVSATLDGRPIAMDQVGGLACHDYEYPIIRCFDSVASLDADVAIEGAHQRASLAALVPQGGYVVIYEHAAYGGSNPKILTTSVPWLSDIGWNDKISSFKSFGATGEFYENSPSGGLVFYFSTTTQVPTLNGTYNDKFSAIYIN